MARKSTVQRALILCRQCGWYVEVVETWNSVPERPGAVSKGFGIRKDFLGFADLMAFHPEALLAIQVTDETGVAAHVTKLLAEPNVGRCLARGMRIEIWGMRTKVVNGSGVKGRTFILEEDGSIRVVDGSLALESVLT